MGFNLCGFRYRVQGDGDVQSEHADGAVKIIGVGKPGGIRPYAPDNAEAQQIRRNGSRQQKPADFPRGPDGTCQQRIQQRAQPL